MMKYKTYPLIAGFLATLMLTVVSNGAVTFTGAYSTLLKDSGGTTNAAVGVRYIVVVDVGNDGFGASSTNSIAAGVDLTASTPGVPTAHLFGGDEIIQSSTFAIAGRAATAISNLNLEVSPYANKKFGVYWFSTETGTSTTAGATYGFLTDPGWIIPNAAGTYTFNATVGSGNFLQNTTAMTPALTVQSAPEPSRMILGVVGLGAFLMRRRRTA